MLGMNAGVTLEVTHAVRFNIVAKILYQGTDNGSETLHMEKTE
jgi:hypothetical protein